MAFYWVHGQMCLIVSVFLIWGLAQALVALMLAQRSHEHCQIGAVELDPLAAQQAEENFKASPWHNRLHLTHQDVQTYCQQTTYQFDLIVANPALFCTRR